MEAIVEIAKWFLAKSDPMLIICILLLTFFQYRTAKTLAKHLNLENPSPHPQCGQICAEMKTQHRETREDIQALSSRIDTALKIAAGG
jgi:hypothetical protein